MRLHRFPSLAATVLILLTAACGSPDRAQESPPGKWTGGDQWRLVELARIGSVEGAGPDVFANVVDVTLDPLSRVWVADGQEIHVFDERGRHVRRIGRKGSGPAEFRSIAGMQWDPANRLWVLDSGNARFAIYDTAGLLLDTRRREASLTTSPWPGRFDRQGRLYDVDGGVRPDGSIRTSVIRFNPAREARDTFEIPFFKEEVFEFTRGDARNRTVTQINVPFTGTQLWALDPEGYVWIANTAQYRLERHRFTGGIQSVMQRNHAAVPVTREERQRRLDEYQDFVRQGGRIDPSRIPRAYPALYGFLFDDEGHLWVSPITPANQSRVLDVFELNGSYLGRVSLPTARRSSPRMIRNNRMLVVERDSLDVPRVILLSIQKPGR